MKVETVGLITALIALVAAGTNLAAALIKTRNEVGGSTHPKPGGRHRRG